MDQEGEEIIEEIIIEDKKKEELDYEKIYNEDVK